VDPGSGWIGRNGEVWFSTNAETIPFLQPARGVSRGPTRNAIAMVQNMDSVFNLFFTEEMTDLIVSMTNLHGHHTMRNWTGVDSTDLCAYMGLLILILLCLSDCFHLFVYIISQCTCTLFIFHTQHISYSWFITSLEISLFWPVPFKRYVFGV